VNLALPQGKAISQTLNYPPAAMGSALAQILQPEVDYFCLTAGIAKSLLDLPERFSPIREDSVVIQEADPPGILKYIISSTAKEGNPWL
jgi:hypothetical protein